MKDFGVGILCFLRPKYLVDRVKEINRHLPGKRIVILIDKYSGENSLLKELNREVFEVSQSLHRSGSIAQVIHPTSNLGVKRAFFELGRAVVKDGDHFLYIEDDIRIKKDPSNFLVNCVEKFEEDSNVVLATLFDTTRHIPNSHLKEAIRQTLFPKMWGVLVKRSFLCSFENTEEFDPDSIEKLVSRFEFSDSSLEKEIVDIWEWKMKKSLSSNTAWDTNLQYFMWNKRFRALAPDKKYVRDLGTDNTSVSNRKRREFVLPHRAKLRSVDGELMCIRCEILGVSRYLSRGSKIRLHGAVLNFK